MNKGTIIWEKLVHFQTVPKSKRSFSWLHKIVFSGGKEKIVNSSIN